MPNNIYVYDNIYIYDVNHGEYGGIVLANTEEEATKKVKAKYEWCFGDGCESRTLYICKARSSQNYDKDNPRVLEIYS